MTESTIDSADVAPEESPVLDALEQFAQFADEIYDAPHPRSIYWEGNPNRIAIRSVGRVLSKWRHAVKPNRPPSALIVRLARRLPSVLADVAGHPKRILQRRRAMQPINRLRELDSSCVRWLTRQPGNTLAEKSGHRRTVLAVQRYESVDTLENRVVRDLLKRCVSLANDYLRQHQASYPTHEWIRMTADFFKLCRRLESLPWLQEVSSLPSLPKPNYVLLHESRYKKIWHSYMEVIRQQRRRQQLWTWRYRAFADMATIAWLSTASRCLNDRQAKKTAHRFDLRIRETPLRGSFFDWGARPPIWNTGSDSFFYIGPMESAGDVMRVMGSCGIEIDEGNFGAMVDHPQQDVFIASWNRDQYEAVTLRVAFAERPVRMRATEDVPDGETEAVLTLIDLVTGKELDTHTVPLTLIENSSSLDPLHQKWCLL
ncbi:DUF2357 domain-containing protein [Stieleria sp. JC731]|uniref:DUF2357 domain-containing protein n=1 Tax=Pirellulaceae TaxID=2691357 RepID=UPI001E3D6976|nr:DUF2357 domain-containing protein [Stieleria sp. JC731]MCC9601023.1 DUF2357 domain-containing protein [Stieleria sp. JC731]